MVGIKIEMIKKLPIMPIYKCQERKIWFYCFFVILLNFLTFFHFFLTPCIYQFFQFFHSNAKLIYFFKLIENLKVKFKWWGIFLIFLKKYDFFNILRIYRDFVIFCLDPPLWHPVYREKFQRLRVFETISINYIHKHQ